MFCTNLATKLTPISTSVQDLLLKYPRGRYTVCRTLEYKIVDWPFHKARLFPNPLLEPLLSSSIKDYFKTTQKEAKITILTVNDSKESILLHFSDYVPFPINAPVSCLVAQNDTARNNPNVKDSAWIADRRPIVDQTYHETILVSPDGDILEGSTSNLVFILSDKNTLITAPIDAVLPGSVLSVVAAVADIQYRFTRRQEYKEWKGAFLTSTSRVLVPVGELVWGQDGFKVVFEQDAEYLNELRGKVMEEMKKRAIEI